MPFERKLARGYPFDADGKDVALADLKRFYAPERGALWAYWKSAMSKEVPRHGEGFTLPKGSRYRGAVVAFLNASRALTDTMFPEGNGDINVEFDVSIEGAAGISLIEFTVDGKEVRYRNGPTKSWTFAWPGEGSAGAKLAVTGRDVRSMIERKGEWGLFRLLEEGTVRRIKGERTFVVQWDLGADTPRIVQLRFTPTSADSPFFGLGGTDSFMSIFRTRRLNAPRSLVVGGPSCRSR